MSAVVLCIRCKTVPAAAKPCCSSHHAPLCHACYRRVHFVEICVEGCADCAREGLEVGESTSAALRRVTAERDQLSVAVAGWADRFHAAYEALCIDEFDGDSCLDLEATIEYAIGAYRRVCASEAAAADQIDQLRAERDEARENLAVYRQELAVALRALRLTGAERDEVRAEVDRLGLSLIKAGQATGAAMAAAEQAVRERDLLRRQLSTARKELEQRARAITHLAARVQELTAAPTSKEMSMTDPMIIAAVEAIWRKLPSEVQDCHEGPEDIRQWVAAGTAAALRVMADEIEVEPSFPMTAALAAELIRGHADGLAGGGSDG